MHPPQRLEHLLCHISQIAVSWAANSLFPERRCNLTFTRPPKMNPDWMIDKYDHVGQSRALFDLIPRAEAVDKPAVGIMNRLNCLPQRWFGGTHPAWLELYRIDLNQWQPMLLGNLICQCCLSATTITNNHHFAHWDRVAQNLPPPRPK